MNRDRFRSDMESAWELRPETDATPGTRAHHNRFTLAKTGEKKSVSEKKPEKKA